MGKFKIGDRVVYNAVGVGGNGALNGVCGTVVYVDKSALPYTVRMDLRFADSVIDERLPFNMENSHRLWWCREDNLTLCDEKSGEETNMGSPLWTPEMDAKMIALRNEGKKPFEIAKVMGLREQQVYKRSQYLRAKERKANQQAPEVSDKPKMTDLEETLQELVSELTAEKDDLQGQLQTARNEADELRAALLHLDEKNGHLEQLLKEANEELEETHNALGRVEERCDKAYIRVAELESERERYIKVVLGLSEKVCEI